MGPASILKDTLPSPNDREQASTIYDSAVKINNMIHRTLELERIDGSADTLLILSTIDIVELCREIFNAFQRNHPAKRFLFHTSDAQLFIDADAVKMESVVSNLLSNACKYSVSENATISMGISATASAVEIVVADDGIGIDARESSLLFQRLYRSPAVKDIREGTGLGLYLIKTYLDLMHGTIDIHSIKGQGTAMVISLPRTSAPPAKAATPTIHSESGKPRVLIVEDNHQIADFIVSILSKEYTCLTADNGRSGLSLAASFMPDVIVVDQMMPVMNGLEMVSHIKGQPRLCSIPIIMLTAKDDAETETASIAHGIEAFMSKPFDPAALKMRISQLIKNRSEMQSRVRAEVITQAQSQPIQAESITEKQLERIATVIEDNISNPDLNVTLLSEKTGIPVKQLYRLIKRYMDVSPVEHIRRVRLRKAATLLSDHRFTVAEVCYMVGFRTPSYFTKCFQDHFGVKPSQYPQS